MTQQSTDVHLACHCLECCGAEVRITARRQKYLATIEQPAHDRLVHKLVAQSRRDAA
jgi:hypothetical protein